jgi:molecular chaperone DnaK (HSP70)
VEELVAMILEHCNDLAAEYAGRAIEKAIRLQPMTHAGFDVEQLVSSHIIIVPPYFDQAAGRALLSYGRRCPLWL